MILPIDVQQLKNQGTTSLTLKLTFLKVFFFNIFYVLIMLEIK